MKTTAYFNFRLEQVDRHLIQDSWILYVIANPEATEIQPDGIIRHWAKISEANDKHLRVVLLEDKQTVHNAFFDRNFGDKS